MVFSSVSFLFYFLPIFLVLYGVLPWRNAVLLIASLVFYSWGEPQNLGLLLICIVVNYAFGLWIGRAHALSDAGQTGNRAKWPFALVILFNLAALLYYKYFNFLSDSWNAILHSLALGKAATALNDTKTPRVALPLGISFFTFHAISYLVDVYRRKTKAERSFVALFTYIIMFPQLVAGPIVRFSTVARQLHVRRWSWVRVETGAQFFCIGLAQKILIANTAAQAADAIFALSAAELSSQLAWLGAISYSVQIYFDFAGYSLMAIGLGLICGFAFPRNFDLPYTAQSMTDFWRRWHMSLSRWFRDYVYIPLGGNRFGQVRTLFNLFLVFFLCGLWHGANWTFVVWGMLHGSFLVFERLGFDKVLSSLPRLFRHLYTMTAVVVAWVLFRANDFSQAALHVRAMFGFDQQHMALPLMAYCTPSLILCLGCAFFFASGWSKHLTAIVSRAAPMLSAVGQRIGLVMLLLMCCVSLASGAYNPFIYFRF